MANQSVLPGLVGLLQLIDDSWSKQRRDDYVKAVIEVAMEHATEADRVVIAEMLKELGWAPSGGTP